MREVPLEPVGDLGRATQRGRGGGFGGREECPSSRSYCTAIGADRPPRTPRHSSHATAHATAPARDRPSSRPPNATRLSRVTSWPMASNSRRTSPIPAFAQFDREVRLARRRFPDDTDAARMRPARCSRPARDARYPRRHAPANRRRRTRAARRWPDRSAGWPAACRSSAAADPWWPDRGDRPA